MSLNGFGVSVERMLQQIGRNVAIRTVTQTGTDYDPTLSYSDVTARAAVFDYGANEVDGSVIQREDKKIVFAPDSAVSKNNVIIDGGVEYAVVAVETVAPGGEVIMYKVQGRA